MKTNARTTNGSIRNGNAMEKGKLAIDLAVAFALVVLAIEAAAAVNIASFAAETQPAEAVMNEAVVEKVVSQSNPGYEVTDIKAFDNSYMITAETKSEETAVPDNPDGDIDGIGTAELVEVIDIR